VVNRRYQLSNIGRQRYSGGAEHSIETWDGNFRCSRSKGTIDVLMFMQDVHNRVGAGLSSRATGISGGRRCLGSK